MLPLQWLGSLLCVRSAPGLGMSTPPMCHGHGQKKKKKEKKRNQESQKYSRKNNTSLQPCRPLRILLREKWSLGTVWHDGPHRCSGTHSARAGNTQFQAPACFLHLPRAPGAVRFPLNPCHALGGAWMDLLTTFSKHSCAGG